MDAGRDAGSSDAGSGSGSCPAGATLRQYSLTSVSPLPAASMIQLPNLIPGAQIISAGNGVEYNARFDVCDDGGTLRLASLLVSGSSFDTPGFFRWDDTVTTVVEDIVELDEGLVLERRLPPASFLVEGLEAALQGNLQTLRIRLLGASGLLIVGHDGFLALAHGMVGEDTIEYTSIFVVVGGLEEGNVFAGLECPFGESPYAKTFTLGTATFEVKSCNFLGGGETIGYRITSLAVQDTSPELTEAERQRFDFAGEEEVESVMTYVWNHHNACDSFHLALLHADYAATTSPLAGCGTAVPNAPQRDINEDPGSPVKFRIRRHQGAWTDGEMDACTHYLFCN
jgi:hypothetical protein